MAVIRFHTKNPDSEDFSKEIIIHDGSVMGWIVENIKQGENFKVYEGGICKSNEISRDTDSMYKAADVDVFVLAGLASAVLYAVVAVLAVVALTPKIGALPNVNRRQQSPNNSLSARNNEPRPNARIVDICGTVKSIPDVIQGEFAQFNNNIEERIGYYCVGRNQLQIEDIKDGDSFVRDIENSSAGVYYPNKSPNNSSPDIQVGDPINELVKGVFQSSDAIGQNLEAPNSETLEITTTVRANSAGYFEDLTGEFIFTELFEAGDNVDIVNVWVDLDGGFPAQVGQLTHTVLSVTDTRITFDITGDSSWDDIDGGEQPIRDRDDPSLIVKNEDKTIGFFTISSQKIDELVVNVYAQSGMYKEDSSGRKRASVDYTVTYQKLDDNLNPVGPETPVHQTISGLDGNVKGNTTRIDLLAPTFVKWSVLRTTSLDFNYDGQIVDTIKLKDVFGLFDINRSDFGNITTIQTKRTSVSQATSIRNPELNCIATELVYEYLGNGVFDTNLTPNNKAMQSLIRVALDPFIGRRGIEELDADNLLTVQDDIDNYFQSDEAGQFSYSFDSTSLTAEETFFTIGQAAFTTLWREGRVLKAWFEKPQTVPSMVFTHRSKQQGNETWKRDLNGKSKKDSIEFIYTDDAKYTQETLYFPSDRSGTNPLRVEMPGVKGLQQATWQMMRRYNKLLYQEISLDFGATSEGRFVKPRRMISVVKGSRTDTYDGYIMAVNGLLYTLSQEVSFVDGDDHYLILKNRDGSTESVMVTGTDNPRIVQLLQIPTNEPYTGNDELKTEFSLGNEARLSGQLMMPESIEPSDREYVNIKAVNYSDLYYQNDPDQAILGGFDSGFDSGFN